MFIHNLLLYVFFSRPFITKVYEVFENATGRCVPIGTYSRKDDILQLRDLLQTYLTELGEKKIKSLVTSFLEACTNANSIDELIDHPFLIYAESSSIPLPMISNNGVDFGSSNSRLKNEFIYLEFLGKGGFGDVVLARNKLDGNDYAIKRIPLDPKDDKLNKKVMREAKLFSRLCHPNVVRYFSAWIEHVSLHFSSTSTSTSAERSCEKKCDRFAEDSILPPQLRNVELRAASVPVESMAEWSTSFHRLATSSSSSVSESENSDDLSSTAKRFSSNVMSTTNNSDFEVLFEENEDGEVADESSEKESAEFSEKLLKTDFVNAGDSTFRVLYIQMEYCEQSTLRSLIDSRGLSASPRRIWQILKEILFGLHYIHQQGMIHRDIKPMNILIDGAGRAKIGDFGLATRDYLEKQTASFACNDKEESLLTKDIGTALYIAPELLSTTGTTVDYTSKIDVYSVGIVLFEMFYRPLLPGMERISLLKSLRDSFFFPEDFASEAPEVHRKIAKELIKSMLRFSPDERPSVQDILESERIPLIELEESEFQKIFCQAIRSRTGKLRQWMIDTLFSEPVPLAVDFLYDQSVCSPKNCLAIPAMRALEMIQQKLSKICVTHAFVKFSTHSIVPSQSSGNSPSTASKLHECRFIDDSGVNVSLPFDLRRAFIRYCVRNGINRLKRFSFGKVFGFSDVLGGTHPAERSEFSIDCLGPRSSAPLLSAEVLCIILEAISQIDLFKSFKWQLRVGHRFLVAAATTYLGYGDATAQRKIINALHTISSSEEALNRKQRIDLLQDVGAMSYNQAASLLNILEGDESNFNALRERFRPLLRGRNDIVKELAKKGFDDLTNCYDILGALSDIADCIMFDGSLCCRPLTFSSGLVFQLTVNYPRKRGGIRPVIICYGGHYDELLERERCVRDPAPPTPLCAVGCGFVMDSLARLHCSQFPEYGKSLCSALVCSISADLLMETVRLVRLLWESGISADVLFDPVSSAHELGLIEHCAEKQIENILIVMARNEVFLRSRNLDCGKMSFDDAIFKLDTLSECVGASSSDVIISSSSRQLSNTVSAASTANLSIHYALTEKLAYNVKKRLEVQVPVFMQKTLAVFSSATRVEVIVCDLPCDAVRQLATSIDRNFSPIELHVAFDSLSLHLNKYKKELKCIHDTLENIYQMKENCVIAVYSRVDSNGYCKFIF